MGVFRSSAAVVATFLAAPGALAVGCGGKAVDYVDPKSNGVGGDQVIADDDTGATGGQSTTTGGSTSLGVSGSGPFMPGSGGGGGSPDCSPLCATVIVADACESMGQDFESVTEIDEETGFILEYQNGELIWDPLETGTYAYGDGGAMKVTLETTDGGDGSSKSFHYEEIAAVQWGGGFGFWFYCTDVSAFSGVSFWLKGTLPQAAVTAVEPGMEIGFYNPDTTIWEGCGTCAGTCRPARVYQEITSDWALYEYTWADIGFGNAGSATPDTLFDPTQLTGINFHVPAAVGEDIDVSIDEFSFVSEVPHDQCATGGAGGQSSLDGSAGSGWSPGGGGN
jgi:hypothetical protein